MSQSNSQEVSLKSFVRSPKVLLVEDDVVVQRVHSMVLKQLECSVELAQDGAEALKICKTNVYDLILMDIGLPVLSGLEVSHLIRYRTKNEGKRVPIIACTGFGDLRHEQLEWAEIDDILIKPAAPEELAAKLKKWLPELVKIIDCNIQAL